MIGPAPWADSRSSVIMPAPCAFPYAFLVEEKFDKASMQGVVHSPGCAHRGMLVMRKSSLLFVKVDGKLRTPGTVSFTEFQMYHRFSISRCGHCCCCCRRNLSDPRACTTTTWWYSRCPRGLWALAIENIYLKPGYMQSFGKAKERGQTTC